MNIHPMHHVVATGLVLAYYRSELDYVLGSKRNADGRSQGLKYANKGFRDCLHYFGVDRRLNSKRKDRFEFLLGLAVGWGKKPPDQVDGIIKSLSEGKDCYDENRICLFSHPGQEEIALVTKVLFLSNPWEITPYDSNVVAAAEALGGPIGTYVAYHDFFIEFKKAHQREIGPRLDFVRGYTSVIESGFETELDPIETIRLNRYVDRLLFAIGESVNKRSRSPNQSASGGFE